MTVTIFTWREVISATQVRLHFRLPNGDRRAVTVERAYDTPEHIAALKEAFDADRVQTKEHIKREGLR